jgi:hypothetical protein
VKVVEKLMTIIISRGQKVTSETLNFVAISMMIAYATRFVSELDMGHFFQTQPSPKILQPNPTQKFLSLPHPTQPNPTQPNPTQHNPWMDPTHVQL